MFVSPALPPKKWVRVTSYCLAIHVWFMVFLYRYLFSATIIIQQHRQQYASVKFPIISFILLNLKVFSRKKKKKKKKWNGVFPMQTKPSYNVFRTIKHQKGSVVILKHSKFRIGPKFMHRSNKFQSYPLRLCAKQTNKQKNCINKCAFLPRGFFMHNHAKITQCILEWNLFY